MLDMRGCDLRVFVIESYLCRHLGDIFNEKLQNVSEEQRRARLNLPDLLIRLHDPLYLVHRDF